MDDSRHGNACLEVAHAANLDKYQMKVFQAVTERLKGSTCILSFAANAGSGKTKTITTIVNGLIAGGMSPDQIHATTFTNAAAEDIRAKVIASHLSERLRSLVAADGSLPFSKPHNIHISTIHAHAMDTLKRLDPHIPGVSYYFEDQTGGGSGSTGDNERSEFAKSVTLSVLSTIHHHPDGATIAEAARRHFAGAAMETVFPVQSIFETGDILEKAENLVQREMATGMGLGAFTNVGESGPDYSLAIATDALMRLWVSRMKGFDASPVALPRVLFVDEAQDIDINQLFYMFALALNGCSVVMVGDPRQTLYEFRNAISHVPFADQILKDVMQGVEAEVLNVALTINYRSRKGIVDAAEVLSDKYVDLSSSTLNPRIRSNPVIDPPSIRRSEPSETIPADEHARRAVKVVVGGDYDALAEEEEQLVPEGDVSGMEDMFLDPLVALTMAQKASVAPKTQKAPKAPKKSKREARKDQPAYAQGSLGKLAGGDGQEEIEEAIGALYKRALEGESVAILAKKRLMAHDRDLIMKIIERYCGREIAANRMKPQDHPRGRLKLRTLNTDSPSCLSSYRTVVEDAGGKLRIADVVPISNLLVASAIDFFFTSDPDADVKFKEMNRIQGRRERDPGAWAKIRRISIVPPEKFEKYHPRVQTEATIRIELEPFLGAARQMLGRNGIHVGSAFEIACVRFCYAVLARYSADIWRARNERAATKDAERMGAEPCRFYECVHEYDFETKRRSLRSWREMKTSFRRFWSAIAATPLAIEDVLKDQMCADGLHREWCAPDVNLKGFHERMIWLAERNPAISSDLDGARSDREESYRQFSTLWHLKTRQFTRGMARHVAKLRRDFANEGREEILARAFNDHFMEVKRSCRLSTFCGKDGNYTGLFKDFVNTPEEVTLGRAPKRRETGEDSGPVTIDLSTVHASKGLEWQHVVYFVAAASPKDYEASPKSFRDALYVAVTRAARTLFIVVPKNAKDDEKAGGGKLVIRAVHAAAAENGWFDGELDYGPVRKEGHGSGVTVYEETSHTNIEAGLTCRVWLDFQKRRSLPTMSPLALPDYSFFFHRTMAALCSALANQRIKTQFDPVFPIADWIEATLNAVRGRSELSEQSLREEMLRKFGPDAPGGGHLMALSQRMVPLYNRLDHERSDLLVGRYCEALARHIAAIMKGSELFEQIMLARGRPGCAILIEKPLREVIQHAADGTITPLYGIPDIRILTPEALYVFDYKTVSQKDEEKSAEEYEVSVSNKTAIQVNLYQGLHGHLPGTVRSELIYVLNVTVPDGLPVPQDIGVLPEFSGGNGFRSEAGLAHARILKGEGFDSGKFARVQAMVQTLCEDSLRTTLDDPDYFKPCPVIGDIDLPVAGSQCRSCQHAIHCHRSLADAQVPVTTAEHEEEEYDFNA